MFLKPVFISVAIMLSSTVRAFTSAPATTTFGAIKRMGPSFIARSMTSTSEADTTIVSTCREKIMKALETDDVTVTGKFQHVPCRDIAYIDLCSGCISVVASLNFPILIRGSEKCQYSEKQFN